MKYHDVFRRRVGSMCPAGEKPGRAVKKMPSKRRIRSQALLYLRARGREGVVLRGV